MNTRAILRGSNLTPTNKNGERTMTKVYVLMGWQRGAWQPDHEVMGIFLSMESAEKRMQEYKKDGLNVAGMHIEEHEVEQ